MIRLLISAGIRLLANTIGLLVATAVLDGMTIDAASFIMAVIIFTVVEVVFEPMLRQMAMRSAQALMGSVSLIITFVGLLVTELVSDGLQITGLSTWVLATIIVWLAALIAGLILPLILVKRVASDRRASSGGR
ncbi:MAG TPA: phage holin family protein [Dermatophilaceae bacterium]|nr:phage holin family protein [Dermatophilaceae bacterium]